MGFLATSRKAYAGALDVLFPPRCFACGVLTDAHGNLCAGCWGSVDFISAPYCARCGDPFAYNMGGIASECGICLTEPPPFTKARAVFRYGETSKKLITGYKYHDRTHATPMFARWLKRAGEDFLPGCDVLVPVPLHRRRLLTRRYNQSALLARALAKEAGIPAQLDGLLRVRHTAQQAGLSRKERQENVKDAFMLNPSFADGVKGKRAALIDDVMTTGATLHACTKVLMDAGATEVHILTLARRVMDN